MLAKNIRHLRGLKGLTQEVLAEDLRISRSRIGSYEEGRSTPTTETLIALSDYFKLPVDVLLRNDLTKTTDAAFIEIGNQRVLFPIQIDDSNNDVIEVVSISATAGYLEGYSDPEYIEQLQKIKLPFLAPGKYRAFPIKGDSMLPVKDGTYIVGRYIEERSEIINGRTYIVVTLTNGLVYKRVYNFIKDKNNLLLVSDNKTYSPYEVAIDDVLELWEFTCSISTQEYNEDELSVNSIINSFNTLNSELNTLKQLNKK